MPDHWLPAAALGIDWLIGYPDLLLRHVGHPVMAQGAAIGALERQLNRLGEDRRVAGAAMILLVAGGSAAIAWLIARAIGNTMVIALICSAGLAQRALRDHVEAVRDPLTRGDLVAARRALSHIVGRDTDELDDRGIARAAIESLAESFNDGVVAPMFWLAVLGPAGLFAFKAVNTADSLVGHRTERFRSFGWASARLDDVLAFVPARLSALIIAVAAGTGWRTARDYARRHESPNAGWPESAMAGALDRKLGGPVSYEGIAADRAWLGEGSDVDPSDLSRALAVYRRASLLLFAAGLAWGLAWQV